MQAAGTEMSEAPVAGVSSPDTHGADGRVVYKVVLTGGPCAGKTTTVARLRTFFESLGWKVYTVPEAATVLLGGGVKFDSVSAAQARKFQENVLRSILQLEKTFFDMAEEDQGNVLIVCDRGAMDPSAFSPEEEWKGIMASVGVDSVQLRDERYDQIVHMVSAANGAERFYQLSNNPTRSEGLKLAREQDNKAAQAWVGHPYCDIIDNTTDFENKIRRVIEVVCKRLGKRLGVNIDDRLQAQSRKKKFLVTTVPDIKEFPQVQDFEVQHDYLLSSDPQTQIRIRKRGQNGKYMYTHTERKMVNGERVEQIIQLTKRQYQMLYKQRDPKHHTIHKTRRCFLWKEHYFQLDILKTPCTERCHNLALLETYTTKESLELPSFLDVVREVTEDPHYSMYYLSALTTTSTEVSTDNASGTGDTSEH